MYNCFINKYRYTIKYLVEDVNDVIPRIEIDYPNSPQKQWAEVIENKGTGAFIAFVHVYFIYYKI